MARDVVGVKESHVDGKQWNAIRNRMVSKRTSSIIAASMGRPFPPIIPVYIGFDRVCTGRGIEPAQGTMRLKGGIGRDLRSLWYCRAKSRSGTMELSGVEMLVHLKRRLRSCWSNADCR
jgi:hypothetical protein